MRLESAGRAAARGAAYGPRLPAAVCAALLAACGSDSAIDIAAVQPKYSAEIRRTAMGIPHVMAADWAGLGYGYGYAQAEDNLCTMADSFLTYRGDRSKWFGPDAQLTARGTAGLPNNLNSDFFHRHVMTDAAVKAFADAQAADTRQLFEGFVAGYNRQLGEVKGKPGASHAACRAQAWLQPITVQDLFRRMYATNLSGGYNNWVAQIATAQPPGQLMVGAAASPSRREARNPRATAREARAIGAAFAQIDAGSAHREGVGSNMYGFGSAASDVPLLFGNPHWYWRGPDRFYQAHLSIPGKLDVSGVSFLGVPVIQIGFNRDVAWSHTISTARRFGFFQLTLAVGDNRSYMKDGVKVAMTAHPISVESKAADGTISVVTRTLYSSEHGPIVNLSGVNAALAWTSTTAFAIRDINAGNYRTVSTWRRWGQAQTLDEFAAIQREESAVPWVNTVAVARGSQDAWYADIGTVPNVTDQQLVACATPFSAAVAAGLPRVPLLDGSKAACDWVDDPDSKQRGAIGTSRMPSLLRRDWVANMNDSYWLTNPNAPLTGFPPIMGATNGVQSLRTRLGHLMVQQRLAGTDGHAGNRVTVDALKEMVLGSRVLSAELARADVVNALCATASINLQNDVVTSTVFNPAVPVDVSAACAALRDWAGTGVADARGTHVWDEFWSRAERLPAAQLFKVPFDVTDPVNTPRGLNIANLAPLQQALAAAVYRVQQSGFAVNAQRKEVLFVTRGAGRVGLYGGCGARGYFTIACSENRIEQGGYSMDQNPLGNTYIQVVAFPPSGVQAHTFLTFSQSDDPASPHHGDYTQRYAQRSWLRLPFTEAEIAADPALRRVSIQEQ